MRSWRFKLQLAVLILSLLFILGILGTYAYVGISYSQGQGLPSDRRQLAEIAGQLERAAQRRLRLWMAGRGTPQAGDGEVLPALASPPAGLKMPPAFVAGAYRASDGELMAVWRRRPGEPASREGPAGRPPPPGERPERAAPPGPFPPPGRRRSGIPPREREALGRLCQQAVREQSGTYELLARPDMAILLYARPLRDGSNVIGAVWALRWLRETPVGALSVWALPATIAAALVGISLALWTAVKLQRDLMALQAGLALGREMVASLIPADAPEMEGYEVARRVQPATEVGGDFYNLFPVSRSSVGLVLGDIAGTGLAAALGMAVVTTLLEEYARAGLSPAAVLTKASERLERRLRARRTFATALYGRLDLAMHTLCLSNAGQTPCIWLRDGHADYVRIPGTPLGRIGAAGYREETLKLAIGDTLVFATDGFVEMRNGQDRPLGYDGWLKLVAQHRDCSPVELVERLFAAVASPPFDPSHRDDLTLLVLRRSR
jgi:hypothetical protein